MVDQNDRDNHWKNRKERLDRFIKTLPTMEIEIIKPLGPYRVGDKPTVSCITGNGYIERGYAKKI